MSFFRFPLAPPMYITPLVYNPKIVSGHLECAPSQSCGGAKPFSIFSMHLTFSSTGEFVLFYPCSFCSVTVHCASSVLLQNSFYTS